MRKLFLFIAGLIIVVLAVIVTSQTFHKNGTVQTAPETSWWDIQSIDTMKYSRDLAREKAYDSLFDREIEQQVASISAVGGTHVAIGTPYDKEFIPYMKRWVNAARRHNLHVWFRGNFSGWEGWFGHKKITRDQHTELLTAFIEANGDVFETGDIFSPCTECENGGPGDPRRTGDAVGHRQFLTQEHEAANAAFRKVGKNVRITHPMNGDVANLIMDKETTQALGGIVTIDHYVPTAKKMAEDITSLASKSGGKILIGEFGAPIPDLHGSQNEEAQAAWIHGAFTELAPLSSLIGVSYWTGYGGSTKLWESNGTPRKAVAVLSNYFIPRIVMGSVYNELNQPIQGAVVTVGPRQKGVDANGAFSIPFINNDEQLVVQADGYKTITQQLNTEVPMQIVLVKEQEGPLFFLMKQVNRLL